MPSTLFSSDSAKTHQRLVLGAVVVFVILFGIGYWLYQKTTVADVLIPTNSETLPPATASTPAEVKSQYEAALLKVKTEINQTTSVEQKTKILNDFFFSVRVPSEAREAHLAALLKFKATTSAEGINTIVSDLETKIRTTTSTSL